MNGWSHVWQCAEDLRGRYLVGDLAHLPVDVFTLAEIELRLDVVPFDDLFEKYSSDAALMLDFSGIYVDAEAYLLWEKGPLWKQRRLRFSVAHELGHFVMHRDIASRLAFRTLDDFARWTKGNHGNQYSIEQEANEFGGRLLVPVDRLKASFDRFAAAVQDIVPHWQSSGDLRHSFAESARETFEVSAQVIETRLEREGIWPSC